MLAKPDTDDVAFPYPDPPGPGQVREVAQGVLWLRFALPFLLNHVNAYLIEDDGGWAAFDTGLGDDATRAAWEAVFAGPLHGCRLSRVVCSHFHPDHVGLAGWLTQRFDCPLWMPRTEMMMTQLLESRAPVSRSAFYAEHGLAVDAGSRVAGEGHGYLRMITGVPPQYQRLVAGQSVRIGGRDFSIATGGGHAPEQAMLHCAADGLFFSADQVLTKISPNISVQSMEPDADPLGEYLDSLAALGRDIPGDVLVLPGHHVPFTGLHTRVGELATHHATRCALIADAVRAAPRSAAELVPVLFKREMDSHQTGFAFGETLAHVNFMRARGELVQERGPDGIVRVHAA
jgi:glyoxylase-like metal-dependent hydrolase (beta-lactamase superfamily II)